MKTITYCISNVIRYYISVVIRYRAEYKFLIKMCMYICIMKKKTGTQYSLKSIGTVENPSFYNGKVTPRKSNVQKLTLLLK